MRIRLLLSFLFSILVLQGQEKPLALFEPLMEKEWSAEGKWGDGSLFKQEIQLAYSLDSMLVMVRSKGFTDSEQRQYGHRNHGIRRFDAQAKQLMFYEFDVFGNMTQGSVSKKNKDIIYTYDYQGTTVTDYWAYIDANTYSFKVGVYDGTWQQVFLETTFTGKPIQPETYHFDHQSLVVGNLMETGDFYRDVMGLEEIPHPEQKPGFRWFTIYGNSKLQLVKKEFTEFPKDKSIHFSLSVSNLEKFIENLLVHDVLFYDWPGNENGVTDRADGVKQIYFQDPEGYWIEINTASH
ncbi:MAG: VOC family protein [Bacteroidota bacterium]